jgi:hypothetical protein
MLRHRTSIGGLTGHRIGALAPRPTLCSFRSLSRIRRFRRRKPTTTLPVNLEAKAGEIFQKCDHNEDGVLEGSELGLLEEELNRLGGSRASLTELVEALPSSDRVTLPDLEFLLLGMRKHDEGDLRALTACPHGRVLTFHGAPPPCSTVHPDLKQATSISPTTAAMAFVVEPLLKQQGYSYSAYSFLRDGQSYIDPEAARVPHFSVGRVLEQGRDALLHVQYGAGTLKRSLGEDSDNFDNAFVLHHARERQEDWFEAASPYIMPYPRVAPGAASVVCVADDWMATADSIPFFGVMRGGVRITRSSFIRLRETLPQEYFWMIAPGFVPPIRVYAFTPLKSIENALQAVWPLPAPGVAATDIRIEVAPREGGEEWRAPPPGARLDDVLTRARLRLWVDGATVEVNNGTPVERYGPSFMSRTFGMCRSWS